MSAQRDGRAQEGKQGMLCLRSGPENWFRGLVWCVLHWVQQLFYCNVFSHQRNLDTYEHWISFESIKDIGHIPLR